MTGNLLLSSTKSRTAAKHMNNADGPMLRIVSSKKMVKSNRLRQDGTLGPKPWSAAMEHALVSIVGNYPINKNRDKGITGRRHGLEQYYVVRS
jgi:hypothetical protein